MSVAQEPPSYAPAAGTPAPAPAAPAPTTPVTLGPANSNDEARIATAHSDRIILLPTAYTHPEGTLYFSNYDIVLLQAGYAVTDFTQVTLSMIPFLAEQEEVLPFDVTLKTRGDDDELVRFAATASLTGLGGLEDVGVVVAGRFGGIAQFCFESSCRSSLSASTHLAALGPAVVLGTGIAGEWRVGDWLSLLGEAGIVLPIGSAIGEANGGFWGLGARLPYRSWALDLSFESANGGPALPILAFTYRFL